MPELLEGSNALKLVPPDATGNWRYREMHVLKPAEYDPGYQSFNGTFTMPPKNGVQAFECLVVWEKYSDE